MEREQKTEAKNSDARQIWADYHTHTIYSHGRGSVEDNVRRAEQIGLSEIAITDHGFRHVTYNVRRLDLPALKADIIASRNAHPSVRVYLGVESNITGLNGSIDVEPSDWEYLDICLAGYHKFIRPQELKASFEFFIPALLGFCSGNISPKRLAKNTDMYINAIINNNIDVLTHINLGITADPVVVAECCKEYGTYLELNGKHISLSDEELGKVAQTNVSFIINSDAHSIDKIGLDSYQLEVARRVGIPDEQIANVGKIPLFRSRKARGLS